MFLSKRLCCFLYTDMRVGMCSMQHARHWTTEIDQLFVDQSCPRRHLQRDTDKLTDQAATRHTHNLRRRSLILQVLGFSIMKQARGAAKTTIKFKNLVRGTTIENTYRSGEKFETAQIDKASAQYTYQEGETFFFMNSETFDEIAVDKKVADDKAKWLSEGSEVTLVSFKDSVIEVVVPSPAVYEVVETEPNVKGNTAQGYTKPAVLDCGATINIPGFIDQGTKIRVDTEKGEYIERVTS